MTTAPLVTLFGGSGFLGQHVADALRKRGWRIRIAARGSTAALPDQDSFISVDVKDKASVAAALMGVDAIVNLTGILSPTAQQTFEDVHHVGSRIIAEAAQAAGIRNMVQVSAIGADAASSSAYARSKAAGEQAVLSLMPHAVIARPSIIFGPKDDFFNRFAAMSRFSPALPLIGGGKTLFQPVYAGDVAAMIALALEGKTHSGGVYELGGPERRSFADLLRAIGVMTGRRRLLIPLPMPVAGLVAGGIEMIDKISFGFFPKMFLITRDQVKLLRRDNVVSDQAAREGRTLQGLGITPQTIGEIVPTYLR